MCCWQQRFLPAPVCRLGRRVAQVRYACAASPQQPPLPEDRCSPVSRLQVSASAGLRSKALFVRQKSVIAWPWCIQGPSGALAFAIPFVQTQLMPTEAHASRM